MVVAQKVDGVARGFLLLLAREQRQQREQALGFFRGGRAGAEDFFTLLFPRGDDGGVQEGLRGATGLGVHRHRRRGRSRGLALEHGAGFPEGGRIQNGALAAGAGVGQHPRQPNGGGEHKRAEHDLLCAHGVFSRNVPVVRVGSEPPGIYSVVRKIPLLGLSNHAST